MANKDFPSGMRPISEGGMARPRLREYAVPASQTIGMFSPVIMLAGGGAGAITGEGSIVVVVGVASHAITTAAAETGTLLVWDDPNQLFQIQDDGSGTLAAADVGLNCDFAAPAEAIDSFTGQSICELSGTSKNTTNTLMLKILGKVNRVDNAWGDNVDLIVKFSELVHFNATALGL